MNDMTYEQALQESRSKFLEELVEKSKSLTEGIDIADPLNRAMIDLERVQEASCAILEYMPEADIDYIRRNVTAISEEISARITNSLDILRSLSNRILPREDLRNE